MIETKQHIENSHASARLYRAGIKPTLAVRGHVDLPEVKLELKDGVWMIYARGAGAGFPATDYEVALWLRILELNAQVRNG